MWSGKSFIITTVLLSLSTAACLAQETDGRKLVKHDPPAYPEMARKLSLTGAVKLEVVVNPNGSIKTTKVVGGNPVLAAAAENTVKSWKYEPAPTESTALVVINFKAP